MKSRLARNPRSLRRLRQSGYAYFMAFFMITAMIIGSQAVLRNLVVEGRRDREQEMIWRGHQFERALRLFYRKTGHYPQSVDDLGKGLPSLHFIRPECLKDPMNNADGSWRLIYTNPSGQIIGSVRYATMQQMALMDLNGGKLPSPNESGTSGSSASQDNGSSSNPESSSTTKPDQTGQSQAGQGTSNGQVETAQPVTQSNTNSPFGASMTTTGAPPAQGNGLLSGLNQSALAAIAQLKPTGPVDGPVLGAFIAGVAGGNHYNADSVRFYKGGRKYQAWEFIWNPLEDQARALQNGLNPQPGVVGQQPGQFGLPIANPNGGAPSAPANPPSATPQPSPDQPQQPNQQQ